MNGFNFQQRDSRGFTLIETFVAITILMIAVLGPMSIIAKFYSDSNFAKNQIASSFLAQDGLETVENIINNNTGDRFTDEDCVSNNTDWLDIPLASCKVGGCNVDSFDNKVVACSEEKGCPLQLVAGGDYKGFYVLPRGGGGEELTDTIFKRKITIQDLSNDVPPDSGDLSTYRREAKVTSQVWWTEKGKDMQPVTVSSLIIQFQCQ